MIYSCDSPEDGILAFPRFGHPTELSSNWWPGRSSVVVLTFPLFAVVFEDHGNGDVWPVTPLVLFPFPPDPLPELPNHLEVLKRELIEGAETAIVPTNTSREAQPNATLRVWMFFTE
jgi:hypothetical protein